MKIVIGGATGFIGTPLCELLIQNGHEIIILTRTLRRTASHSKLVRHVVWHPEDETSIVKEVDGSDAVINLAGESVVTCWSKKQKEKILTSRVNATQILVKSIQRAAKKPKTLINASAIGYYGSCGNQQLDADSPAGKDFLASVCKAWEAHAIRAKDFGIRVVRVRIGIVLGKNGGALKKMLPPFKLGLGGWLGDGNQWMSWIHIDDVVRLIEFCLTHEQVRDAVVATSPKPVTNKVFSMVLAQVLKRPCFMPVPAFVLKILLGEMADALLLGSQQMGQKRMLSHGFSFKHLDIRGALEAILTK